MAKAVSGTAGNYHEACASSSITAIADDDNPLDLVTVDDDEICAGCGGILAAAALTEIEDDVEDDLEGDEDIEDEEDEIEDDLEDEPNV